MIILDVRTTSEYQDEHLEQAINLPVQDLHTNTPGAQEILNTIAKDVPVKVHCASGGRSALAKQILESKGYTNVENLGGLEDARVYMENLKK